MAWILTIDLPADQVDVVTDQLWSLGTDGVAELPGNDGPQLLAGFPTIESAEAAQRVFGGTIAPVDPSQWATPEARTIAVGPHSLTIDAGHSFGHGDHATTQLCLRALKRHVRPGMSVLDLGCGSGVLALAARLLGATPVVGVDVDPAALTATEHNATNNRLDVEVSDTPVGQLERSFDLVVVNMLIAELEPIAPDVDRVAGDVLILSGALTEQADRWSALFPNRPVLDASVDGEWAGHTLGGRKA